MADALLAGTDGDAILAAMPLPVLVMDSASRVLFANEACETILGKARRKIEGRKISKILTFADVRLNRALAAGEDDLKAQDMLLEIGDDKLNVDISISAFERYEKDQLLIILIPRNADRSHLNDQSRSGQQQGIGAPAILGHEIKNPLAGIRGAAQLLSKQGEDSQKPLTDLIVTEVDRIARLLNQMQDLGGSASVTLAPENIHLVIEHAIRSVRAANRSTPPIAINYDPSLPDVLIDADAMLRVLINLLQNAIDALSGQRNAEITISTRYVMSGALRESLEDQIGEKTIKLPVEITISDNGPGVPPEITAELFSPFVSTKREGQGLGLAIVRKLLQQMHSRITHERDAHLGLTHFRLNLPVSVPERAV